MWFHGFPRWATYVRSGAMQLQTFPRSNAYFHTIITKSLKMNNNKYLPMSPFPFSFSLPRLPVLYIQYCVLFLFSCEEGNLKCKHANTLGSPPGRWLRKSLLKHQAPVNWQSLKHDPKPKEAEHYPDEK